MQTTNAGAVRLAQIVRRRGAAKELALNMGIGADRISVWLKGAPKPNSKHRKLLQQHAEIGVWSWDEEIEVAL